MADGLPETNIEKGLVESEAKTRLEKYGLNKLPEKAPPSGLAVFLAQLKNPLVYILLVAAGVTAALSHFSDMTIILTAVFLNTILGYFQEKKAANALEELKKLIHPSAKVIREGLVKTIGVEYLVPGDIVVLNQGDKVSADGRLVKANRFFVDEAILTGESMPVERGEGDEVFMGTVVTGGTGRMLVVKTGARAEIGKIAESIDFSKDTPLRRQLAKFSRRLSLLVFALVLLVFVIGLFTGKNPAEIFTTSVALAVSAIPEGLLVSLTAVLAIGMQKILKKKGLVRNLASAETLGGVTTICVDKTGTLTQGKMQVVNVIGEEVEIATQMILANDLDDPVVITAWEWAKDKVWSVGGINNNHERLDSIPFSSADRMFVSLHTWSEENNIIFVNGAPENLIEISKLTPEQKRKISERIDVLSSGGKRLIGLARKLVPLSRNSIETSDVRSGLDFIGVLAFSDPVREDVRMALEKTKAAGIKTIVITGDYALTALHVLHELGLEVENEDIILGTDIDKMDEKKLEARLFRNENIKLFARTKPSQKLQIVDILKKHGEVVAMMGDGVNDAPALSKADIGIVVNEATEVAKESSDLVLLDSSFSTITAAIEEGRSIFDNLRKIVLYLMSDSFVEIIIVTLALIAKLPLPITAAQILWVNLISDGFPSLALTVDPKAPGIMSGPPRSPKEPLVTGWMRMLMGIISVTGGIATFLLFVTILKTTGDPIFARSVAFAAVGVNSLIYVFSIRTLKEPFWRDGIFDNRWLIAAVVGGLALQILPFASNSLKGFFGLKSLGWYWIVVFTVAFLMFLVSEASKWVFLRRLR